MAHTPHNWTTGETIAAAPLNALEQDLVTAIQRANHTGTQSADTLTDGTTNKAFLATERTKLAGIATAASAVQVDGVGVSTLNVSSTPVTAATLGAVSSTTVTTMTVLTAAAYAALGTKDLGTLYVVVG